MKKFPTFGQRLDRLLKIGVTDLGMTNAIKQWGLEGALKHWELLLGRPAGIERTMLRRTR